MDRLEEKVLSTIKMQAMIPENSHVVVGLSGGMDSVCLLFVLLSLRSRLRIRVSAVHVNHGLRGEASDADQAFVEELCAKQAVWLKVYAGDVNKLAAESGRSLEEAGRDFRYQCFEQALSEMGADRIAVAHHREDLCETVLMNLCRGAGVRGLASIPAVRGTVIRPLIDVPRSWIETWMRERQQLFCEDLSNADTAYTRNRIRHEILPALENGVNDEAKRHIAETAKDAALIRSFIESETLRAWPEVAERTQDRIVLNVPGLFRLHEVLQAEIVRQAMESMAGSARDLSRSHIQAVCGLMNRQSGRHLDLPYGLEALRDHDDIVIRRRETDRCKNDEAGVRFEFTAPCEMLLSLLGVELPWAKGVYRLKTRVFQAAKMSQIPKNKYTKWFDYDRMSHRLTLRTRCSGDYLGLSGGQQKKLRRVLMDAKVSREERERLLIVADGNHVVWIPALDRISDDLKVTQLTEHILEIQLEEIKNERESQGADTGIRSE